MSRRLRAYVPVHDGTETFWYGPDSDVPARHAKLIGPHAWADGGSGADEAVEEGPTGPTPPPQGGPGSGRDAWAGYAAELGVDVDGDAGRDDIIAAVRDAGHRVE